MCRLPRAAFSAHDAKSRTASPVSASFGRDTWHAADSGPDRNRSSIAVTACASPAISADTEPVMLVAHPAVEAKPFRLCPRPARRRHPRTRPVIRTSTALDHPARPSSIPCDPALRRGGAAVSAVSRASAVRPAAASSASEPAMAWSLGVVSKRYRDNSTTSAIAASCMAKLIPMHTRGPAPNGRYWKRSILSRFPGMKARRHERVGLVPELAVAVDGPGHDQHRARPSDSESPRHVRSRSARG